MWNLIYFIGPSIVALLVCSFFRFFLLKAPQTADAVFPHYEVPEGLSVLEVGALMDNVLQSKDLVYEIYDFYFKGIVSFSEGMYMKLNLAKDSAQFLSLSEVERNTLEILFPGQVAVLNLSSASTKLKANRIKRYIYDVLVDKGFYKKASDRVRAPFYYVSYCLINLSIGYNLYTFFSGSNLVGGRAFSFGFIPFYLMLGLIISGFVVGYFGTLMSKFTEDGVKKCFEIKGFKEFVITAEKDRVEYFMQNSPEVYKGILPYAFMFGVKERWLAPIENLGDNFMDEDLLKISFKMDLDGFEQLFEERRNVFIGCLNIVFYVFIEVIKYSIRSSSYYRQFEEESGLRTSKEQSIYEIAEAERIKASLNKK